MAIDKSICGSVTATYVDQLTSESVQWINAVGETHVIVLDKIKERQRRFLVGLNDKGVRVEEAIFQAGHLKNPDGESVYFDSWRVAGEIALFDSRVIIESQPLLKRLNEKYQRDTLRLFLAKNILRAAQASVIRVQTALALCGPKRIRILLAQPTHLTSDSVRRFFPNVELHFYRNGQSRHSLLLRKLFWDFSRHFYRIVGWGKPIPFQSKLINSAMMIQEDTIRSDRSLRGQPHWLEEENGQRDFTTYISHLTPSLAVADDIQELRKSRLELVYPPTLRAAWKNRSSKKVLKELAQDGRDILRAVMSQKDVVGTVALLYASQLFNEAERMGALAAWLNVRVFITQQLSSDPIQLVAEELNIRTVAVQYSNMGSRSPVMMSTSDDYVIFSEMYKKIFEYDGIAPKNWIISGYLYDGVCAKLRGRADAHRERMERHGASYVICYFDESVQHDRWGLISKDDHLAEIHTLIRLMMEDETLGVVIKSQFMRNSPSLLYPKDKLIKEALLTGRFLELKEGSNRNDIYPAEAALISDLCVSHKFGATAALESAISGVRTVLINPYGVKTFWDGLYSRATIEFESLNSVIAEIPGARAGTPKGLLLGDWTPILDAFDPIRDGLAIKRLRSYIKACCCEWQKTKHSDYEIGQTGELCA